MPGDSAIPETVSKENMLTPDKTNPTADLLSGGLVVSVLTGLGYVVVYVYQVGYCQRFRIPLELVSIPLSSLVLVGVVGLVAVGYLWFVSMAIPTNLIDIAQPARVFEVTVAIILMLFSVFTVTIVPQPLWQKIAFIVFSAIQSANLAFMKPFQRFASVQRASMFDALHKRYGAAATVALPLTLIIVTASFVAGSFRPLFTQYYPVTVDAEPKIVLAQFGDTIVSARFDFTRRLAYPDFTLYDASKNPPRFAIVKTGAVRCQCELDAPLRIRTLTTANERVRKSGVRTISPKRWMTR